MIQAQRLLGSVHFTPQQAPEPYRNHRWHVQPWMQSLHVLRNADRLEALSGSKDKWLCRTLMQSCCSPPFLLVLRNPSKPYHSHSHINTCIHEKSPRHCIRLHYRRVHLFMTSQNDVINTFHFCKTWTSKIFCQEFGVRDPILFLQLLCGYVTTYFQKSSDIANRKGADLGSTHLGSVWLHKTWGAVDGSNQKSGVKHQVSCLEVVEIPWFTSFFFFFRTIQKVAGNGISEPSTVSNILMELWDLQKRHGQGPTLYHSWN